MKVLSLIAPSNEEIHRYGEALGRILKEHSPDKLLIYAGEDLSIHTPAISELHMFEYGNVRYATWLVIEDILYSLGEPPEYYIIVYPRRGRFKCGDTGYEGIFKSEYGDDIAIIERELAKFYSYIHEDEIELLHVAGGGYVEMEIIMRNLQILEMLKGLGIKTSLKIFSGDMIKDFEIEKRSTYPISLDRGMYKYIQDKKLLLASLLVKYGLYNLFTYDDLVELNELVDGEINRVELDYFSKIYSDREGYRLVVNREGGISKSIVPLSRMKLLFEQVLNNEHIDLNLLIEKGKIFLDIISKLGRVDNYLDILEDEDLVDKIFDLF